MSLAIGERSKARKPDLPVPNEPKETNSIIFEWPLKGLKQMFDSCKGDTKSKVIKSAPFGGGRWTVLFYAQSGLEQFCSLYLNAEPLPHERVHPLLASATATTDGLREGTAIGNSKNKGDSGLEEKWARKGLFRFTFNIQTIEERSTLGTKEAHDHAFSYKTSNWGWAQFAKRDHVYYKNSEVTREDGFLITVTITSSPERPRMADPISHIVPPVLVQAMGSLLDDPEHSDVIFHLYPTRRRAKAGRPEIRKVYAIRKILAARSEYFRLMFEGGFQEAEAEETSDEDEVAYGGARRLTTGQHAPPHPSRSHHAAARAEMANRNASRHGSAGYELGDDGGMSEDDDDVQDPFVEDSDEDSEDDDREQGSPRAHTPADSSQRDYVGSVEYNPHEEEEAEQAESRDDEVDGDAMSDDEAEDTGAGAVTGPAESSSVDTQYTEVQARQYKPETVSRTRNDSPYSDAEMLTPQSATDAGRHDSGLRVSSPAAPSMEASSQHYHLRTPSPKPLPGTSRTKRDRVRAVDGGAAVNSDVPRSAPKGSQAAHREPDRRKRRKVNVLDSAYPTFKALLFFLYTDTVEFAPLTSSFLPIDMAAADDLNESTSAGLMDSASRRTRGDALGNIAEEVAKAHRKRKAVINAYCERNPDKPSPCSAKAMYRLADKLDVPDLKRRAQEHIAMSLTVHNIVWEVFSGFNTQYPDIRKMETDFLLKHWPQVKRSNAMKSIFLRSSAHPGLAEVWPHLLEYLEYRQPEVDDAEETAC